MLWLEQQLVFKLSDIDNKRLEAFIVGKIPKDAIDFDIAKQLQYSINSHHPGVYVNKLFEIMEKENKCWFGELPVSMNSLEKIIFNFAQTLKSIKNGIKGIKMLFSC